MKKVNTKNQFPLKSHASFNPLKAAKQVAETRRILRRSRATVAKAYADVVELLAAN